VPLAIGVLVSPIAGVAMTTPAIAMTAVKAMVMAKMSRLRM
jgi:hypothetical protein